MRTTASLLLLTAALFVGREPAPQEPQPSPPAKQEPKPKAGSAQEVETPGEPRARHRFEGVYRLASRVVDGTTHKRDNRGYLVITKRHLFLSLAAPGTDREHPLVHAGVREWRETRDGVEMVMKLDYHSDTDGKIVLQEFDSQEVRRMQLQRGGIRVYQGDQSWLEFERIE